MLISATRSPKEQGAITRREFPILPKTNGRPKRPLSFVIVWFSGDYFHNILRSECVNDPLNQLITIDNRNNIFYDNLSEAVNAGIAQAQHELIAVVHEDVLLPDGWQRQFEQSLAELEKDDPDWGMVGSVGWTDGGDITGHWSDPHGYSNRLNGRKYVEVARLDEQLMVLRKSANVQFDDLLPSIHHIGRDMASTLLARSRKTYAVDAPTIHKYANEYGDLIEVPEDSPKIRDRKIPAFVADMVCSQEYLYRKWPNWRAQCENTLSRAISPTARGDLLNRPIVLLARGGSGSRLLSTLVADAGVFLGSDINVSGDAMEMVQAIYKGVLNKFQRRAQFQKDGIVPEIRESATRMLQKGQPQGLWGFKLPESILLLPELDAAFSDARYIHLLRDPLATCLRRTHMTARFDNPIGRVAIPLAYRHCGIEPEQSLSDSPALNMAYTTIQQIATTRAYARDHLNGRYLEVRFEDLLNTPSAMITTVTRWLGTAAVDNTLESVIETDRAAQPHHQYLTEVEEEVKLILAPLRKELGYI